MNSYDIGDVIRISNVFTTTATGDAIDPGTVTLVVSSPSGSETTYLYGTDAALEKDSTGHYHCDVSPDVKGIWTYRWTSTGSGQGSEEGDFFVRKRRVA